MVEKTNREEIDVKIAEIETERIRLETDDPEFFIKHPELLGEYIGRKAALSEIKPFIRERTDIVPVDPPTPR